MKCLQWRKKTTKAGKEQKFLFISHTQRSRNNVSSVEATSLSDPSPCTLFPPEIRDQSGFPTFLSFSNHSFPAQNLRPEWREKERKVGRNGRETKSKVVNGTRWTRSSLISEDERGRICDLASFLCIASFEPQAALARASSWLLSCCTSASGSVWGGLEVFLMSNSKTSHWGNF